MTITATHYAYYHLCHRKLWLFSNGVTMEHTSEFVAEGNLIDETSYRNRADKWTQIELPGIKIDYYDSKNRIIREVKKSNKREKAHIEQVKYYLYRFEQEKIPVEFGKIEYPRLRETCEVYLVDEDRLEIPDKLEEIKYIMNREICPDMIKKSLCKYCSYYDFCYAGEEIEL